MSAFLDASAPHPQLLPDVTWSGLEPAQARGEACVVCGPPFVVGREHARVPVGRSAPPVAATVYACEHMCTLLARPGHG